MSNFTSVIANDWSESAYYDSVETEETLNLFWKEETVFKTFFDTLDCKNIIEIACGHGRHVDKYKKKS